MLTITVSPDQYEGSDCISIDVKITTTCKQRFKLVVKIINDLFGTSFSDKTSTDLDASNVDEHIIHEDTHISIRRECTKLSLFAAEIMVKCPCLKPDVPATAFIAWCATNYLEMGKR